MGSEIVILCSSCNCKNSDDTKNCINCGKPLLQYNNVCGMPMLGGSSVNQVLSMRYIIEEQLSEDEAGCTYKAEDAADNSKVLVKALPISVSLSASQIERLKGTSGAFDSLSKLHLKGPKSFDISGEVRYFVYEYQEQQYLQDIEQTENEAAERLAAEASKRVEVQRELQSYKDILETVKSQAIEQADKLRKDYEDKLGLVEKRTAGLTSEFEKKLADEIEARENIKAKIVSYENTISQLNAQIAISEEKYISSIKQADEKVEELSAALSTAKKKIEAVHEEKALQRERAAEQALESFRAQARQQQQKYEEQLDKAEWKIGALTAEVEKLLRKIKKPKTDAYEADSESKLKVALAASVFTLIVTVVCTIGISYLYVYSDGPYKEKAKQWISTLYPTKQEDSDVSPSFDKSITKHENAVNYEQFSIIEPNEKTVKSIAPKIAIQKPVKAKVINGGDKASTNIDQLKILANEGKSDAMFKLSEAYLRGAGVEPDINASIQWLVKAADAGDPNAKYELGMIYYSGEIVERNPDRAVELLFESSSAGFTKAMNQLAQMYCFGDAVGQDYKKAADYYTLSAKKGDIRAMYNLATLYHYGVGVEQNTRKSMLWFIKAARNGDPDSMFKLGFLFENGSNIERDIEKAIYWYQTAAKAGQNDAKKQLLALGKTW